MLIPWLGTGGFDVGSLRLVVGERIDLGLVAVGFDSHLAVLDKEVSQGSLAGTLRHGSEQLVGDGHVTVQVDVIEHGQGGVLDEVIQLLALVSDGVRSAVDFRRTQDEFRLDQVGCYVLYCVHVIHLIRG